MRMTTIIRQIILWSCWSDSSSRSTRDSSVQSNEKSRNEKCDDEKFKQSKSIKLIKSRRMSPEENPYQECNSHLRWWHREEENRAAEKRVTTLTRCNDDHDSWKESRTGCKTKQREMKTWRHKNTKRSKKSSRKIEKMRMKKNACDQRMHLKFI